MDLLRPMLKKCVFVAAVVITFTFLCIVVFVMAVPEWRSAAGSLVSRTYGDVIEKNGTSRLGFILVFVIPIVVGLLTFAYLRWLEKKPWTEALRTSISQALVTVLAVAIVEWVVFLCLVVRGIYNDHEALTKKNGELTKQLDAANEEINDRKQHIYFLDPAMGNLRSLLMDFDMYRHAQKGRQCVMWLSEPENAHSHLAREVAQFSNVVSDCFTFGPFPGANNPDFEKEASDGMVPDAVVFHMDRNDKAAFALSGQLASLLPLKISYVPLPNRKAHYTLGPNAKGDETVIWLQFGTDVKWNSERWTAKRRTESGGV